MRNWVLCLAILSFKAVAFAAEYGTANHHGADMVLADGDVVWGTHTNVGLFEVPAGATVKVKAMDRDTSTSPRLYGWIDVYSKNVTITGTLDATGAGYTGGGGGTGGCTDGAVGHGDYADDRGGNFDGSPGQACAFPQSYGGMGATGDGPLGGSAGAPGYAIGPDNWSEIFDFTTVIGSGGGGGTGAIGGPNIKPVKGAMGGGGGRGGGSIRLFASAKIEVRGNIFARGLGGQNATASQAGSTSPAEDGLSSPPLGPSAGGPGAGGGIVLAAPVLVIPAGSLIDNYGGNEYRYGGGLLKLFCNDCSQINGTAIDRTGYLEQDENLLPGNAWVLQ